MRSLFQDSRSPATRIEDPPPKAGYMLTAAATPLLAAEDTEEPSAIAVDALRPSRVALTIMDA
ncbi:hypothetical protein D1872_330590 [compost metagenome]